MSGETPPFSSGDRSKVGLPDGSIAGSERLVPTPWRYSSEPKTRFDGSFTGRGGSRAAGGSAVSASTPREEVRVGGDARGSMPASPEPVAGLRRGCCARTANPEGSCASGPRTRLETAASSGHFQESPRGKRTGPCWPLVSPASTGLGLASPRGIVMRLAVNTSPEEGWPGSLQASTVEELPDGLVAMLVESEFVGEGPGVDGAEDGELLRSVLFGCARGQRSVGGGI